MNRMYRYLNKNKLIITLACGGFLLNADAQNSDNNNYNINGIKACSDNQASMICFKAAAEKIRAKMIANDCPRNPTPETIQEIASCQASKKLPAEDLAAKITGYDLLNRSPDQFMSEFKECDSANAKCREILKNVLMNQLDMRCERQSSGDQSALSKCKRNGIAVVIKKAEEATLSDAQVRFQKIQTEYSEAKKKLAEIKEGRKEAIRLIPFDSFEQQCSAEWLIFLKDGERKETIDNKFNVKFEKATSRVTLNGMSFSLDLKNGQRSSDFTQINRSKNELEQKNPFVTIDGNSYIVAAGNFDMSEQAHQAFSYAKINVGLGRYYEEKPAKPGDFFEIGIDYRSIGFRGNLAISCSGIAASEEEKNLEKKLAELTQLRQSLLPDSSPKTQSKSITQ